MKLGEKEAPGIFVRKASGLVRAIPPWASLWFPVITTFTPWFFVWPSIISSLYPGVYEIWAIILGGLGITIMSLPMLFLAVAMPRGGANYVTLSRGLHPIFGFFESWTRIIMMPIINALIGIFAAQFISTGLTIIGKVTGNSGLASIGLSLSSTEATIAIAILANVISGLLCLSGVHLLSWVMTVGALIGCASTLLMIGLFLTTPAQTAWDATWGNGAYQEIIDVATKNGWKPVPHDWGVTTAAVLSVTGWIYPNNLMPLAGEVSKPRTSLAVSFIGSGIFLTVLAASLTAAQLKCYGDFISMYTYVVQKGLTDQLKLNPGLESNLILFSSSLTSNNAILWVIGPITGIVTGILNIPTGYYWMERPLFAMAFDGLAPEIFSRVHPRFHTPYYSTLTCLVLSLLCVFLTIPIPYLYSLSFFLACGIANLWWCLAAVVLPFHRPEIYKSGYQWEVKGFPLTVVISIIASFLAFYILFMGLTEMDATSILVNIILYIIAVVHYVGAMHYLRTKGIEPDKIFSIVPPA